MSSNPPGKTSGKSILLMQQRLRAKDAGNASNNESTNTASTTNNTDSNVGSSSSVSGSGGVGLGRPSTGKSAAQLMLAQERMKQNSPGANPSSSSTSTTNHPTSVAPVPINTNSKPKGKDFSAMARSQSQTSADSNQSNTSSAPKSHVPALPIMNKDAAFAVGRSTGKGKDFAAMLNKSSVSSTPPAAPTSSVNITTNSSVPQIPSMNSSGQPARYQTTSPNISTNPNVNGGNVGTARPMFPNPSSQQPLSYPPTHPLSTNTPSNTNMQTNNIQNSNPANNPKPVPMPKPGGRAALIAKNARANLQRRASAGSSNDLTLKQSPQSQPQTSQQQQQHQQQQKKPELVNISNTNTPNISLPMRNSFNTLPLSSTTSTSNSSSINSNGNNSSIPTQAPRPHALPPPKPTPKPTILQSKVSSQSQPSTYTITGIKLQNLLSSISPHYTLDTDAQDQILQLADDFIDKLVSQSMKFAKHRDSKNVDVKDIKLALEKQWGMNVEGFGLGNGGQSKTDKPQKDNTKGKVTMGNGKNGSRGVKRSINDLVS